MEIKSRITVIVCTYNRCTSLVDTLESLDAMDVPGTIEWDVLVVDNNSTDDTQAAVEGVAARSRVPITYLRECKQGLSHARNLGIESTDKPYIAFTDDDILVDRDWLKTLVEVFERQQADCVGGKILPRWLDRRPTWLGDTLLNVLAMLDYGDAPFEFDFHRDSRILFGANFAFRRDVLVRLGMFNPDLGRKLDFGCGEDKEMFEKLERAGGRAIYDPRIVVWHKVFPNRMNKTYFRKWHYSAGRDRAKITKSSRFRVFGIESFLFRDFGRAAAGLVRSLIAGRPDKIFADQLNCILYLSIFRHKVLKS